MWRARKCRRSRGSAHECSRGYDAINALAKAHGVQVVDLRVLAEKNDPFYAGSLAQRAKAEWFAELWAHFGYTTGVHLRRVHYRLVSGDVGYHNTTVRRTRTPRPVGTIGATPGSMRATWAWCARMPSRIIAILPRTSLRPPLPCNQCHAFS